MVDLSGGEQAQVSHLCMDGGNNPNAIQGISAGSARSGLLSTAFFGGGVGVVSTGHPGSVCVLSRSQSGICEKVHESGFSLGLAKAG